MWNPKGEYKWTYLQRERLTSRKQAYGYRGAVRGWADMPTRHKTDKRRDLPQSTGNYIQRLAMICTREEVENICVLCRVWHDSPWTVAQQAPLSMEFSRQAYWSGLLFPTPGVLLDPRIEPHLLHLLNGRQIPYGCATWETHTCTCVCAYAGVCVCVRVCVCVCVCV